MRELFLRDCVYRRVCVFASFRVCVCLCVCMRVYVRACL